MTDVTKIETFIQSSPHPAWLATAQGHCVYANPALERLTGFNSDQINQADWRSFLMEEDRGAASASWQRSLATGTPYREQVRMRGGDGAPRSFELIAFGHKAGDDTELWLFTGLDVKSVAAPKRLDLEAQLQATLNVIPAYTWYALPSGALTFVNERTANYLGLPRDHPLRFGIDTGGEWDLHTALLHPDDREQARRVWASCLSTGTAGEFTFRVPDTEGKYRWFQTRAEPLRANDGTLLYWVGVNLDIDDAKRAEHALCTSEKELREVIDAVPAIVWSTLPDGSNVFVNKRYVEYTGLSAEQVAGSGWQALIHPDDLERHAAKWMEATATGKPHESEVRSRRADGQYRWQLDRGVPLRDEDGNIVKWYGVTTDIEDRKRAEEAADSMSRDLQESKTRLEEAQQIAHVGHWIWDQGNDGLIWSDETYRIFGLKPQERPMSVEEFQEMIHPEDREFLFRSTQAARAGGRPDIEYRIIRPSGEVRIVHSQGATMRDESGHGRQMLGTIQDITDRKRGEEALQQSQFYLAEGQRLAHMGSWAFNPSGFFEYWSQELFKIYGLDLQRGAPTLQQYLAIVHPQDRDFMANTMKRMHAEHSGCDVKMRIVRRDGEQRYIRWVGIPVVEGEGLKGFHGTAVDITEQELLTQELKRQQAHLAEAQKLTHTGSWARRLVDRKMKTVHVSEEWYRVYGFDPADGSPTWENFLERVHPEDRLKWEGTLERAMVEKADYEHEFRILLPNGIVRWIHTVGHPVLSNTEDLEGFVGSSTDITERKSAERERTRLRQLEAELAHVNRVSVLGEMAASLAHEIKQPIAAAITSANSCVEWLAHEPPNLDRARVAAARIDKYGNRAAEIIDRIRSLYKKSPPQRELVDVNGIIYEMLTLLESEASRSSIMVRTDLSAELPKTMADRVQLQQVFMNLVLNAIEAMKDAGGELTVKSEQQDHQLQFSVSDTGVGLPTEKVDQLFSAFFTTKPQGSGMGLAISRSIVESHGGRLWATANEGRGATFHFHLPIHATESSPLGG